MGSLYIANINMEQRRRKTKQSIFVISLATRSIFMYSSRISSKVKRGKANRRHSPKMETSIPLEGTKQKENHKWEKTVCFNGAPINLENTVLVTAISRWMGFRLRQCRVRLTHSASSSRRGQEFKHTLAVLSKHFRQLARHRIGPEEIVI